MKKCWILLAIISALSFLASCQTTSFSEPKPTLSFEDVAVPSLRDNIDAVPQIGGGGVAGAAIHRQWYSTRDHSPGSAG